MSSENSYFYVWYVILNIVLLEKDRYDSYKEKNKYFSSFVDNFILACISLCEWRSKCGIAVAIWDNSSLPRIKY